MCFISVSYCPSVSISSLSSKQHKGGTYKVKCKYCEKIECSEKPAKHTCLACIYSFLPTYQARLEANLEDIKMKFGKAISIKNLLHALDTVTYMLSEWIVEYQLKTYEILKKAVEESKDEMENRTKEKMEKIRKYTT